MVLQAGSQNSPHAADALEQLCQSYWYPLYVFARKKGWSPEDSKDLVQGYFERILTRGDLTTVHPAKGRFRTYLMSSMGHYMANEWDRAQAAKRGGQLTFISIDADDPEERYQYEAPGNETPETFYDRAWAIRVVDTVVARLRAEFQVSGHGDRFDALKGFLLGDHDGVPYSEIGRRLGLTEQAVKSAVHRLRQRFRELFRAEVANTVSDRDEVEEEWHYLVQVMTRQ